MAFLPGQFFNRIGFVKIIQGSQLLETVTGVRLSFRIEKLSAMGGSKGHIAFYNLGPTTRGNLETPNIILELFAGYGTKAENIGMLAKGNCYLTTHARREADVLTTCEIVDGGFVRDTCIFKASFGPGTTNRHVLKACINAIQKVDPTIAVGNVQEIELRTYKKALAFDDVSVSDTMDRLCRAVGWDWGINDGTLYVTPPGGAPAGVEFVLNANSGLIGIPSKASEGTTNQSKTSLGFPFYVFESLLNPLLNIQSVVQVESEFVPKGNYRIYHVTHDGDTFEGAFKTTVEATQV